MLGQVLLRYNNFKHDLISKLRNAQRGKETGPGNFYLGKSRTTRKTYKIIRILT